MNVERETKGYINKIIKSSIVDGPGNRIAIFMQGCNYNCWYCHNPETIEMYNNTNSKIYTPKSLLKELQKYFVFVDGITFSGGEALLQQQFIKEFIEILKDSYDLSVLIDTNGSVNIDNKLIEIVDGFMLDIKAYDKDEHIKITEVNNDLVLKNFFKLQELGKLFEVRTVLCPNTNHDKTIEFVEKHLDDETKYKKITYNSKGVRKKE